jgi:hypothetical protein
MTVELATAPFAWNVQEGDTISLVTDAVCPVCHSALLSISRVTRSIPTYTLAGPGVFLNVRSKELVCTSDGCDYHSTQPEHQTRGEDAL